MPERIPQSVSIRVPLKAYQSADHVSNATGAAIAIVISKNGAAFANPAAGAVNATEIASGWYYVDLATTDVGTQGPLIVRGTGSGVDDVEHVYQVVDPNSLGAAYLDAAVSSRNATAPPTVVQIRTEMDTNSVKLANLDTTVSSRSTYAGTDTPGTTTLLTRLTPARAVNLDNLDATISGTPIAVWAAAARTLTSFGTVAADSAAAVWTASSRTLTSFGTVSTDSAAAVWSAATRTLTAFSFPVVAANALTPQQTANAVWDEPTASHAVPGSTGSALTVSGDPADFAQALLTLDWNTVTGEAQRSMLNALRASRNKVSIADNGDGTGTITVTKEDDVSPAWTATCTFDSAARPISGIDPA